MTLKDIRQPAQTFAIGALAVVGCQLAAWSITGKHRGSPSIILIVVILTTSAWATSRYAKYGTPAPPGVRVVSGLIIAGLSIVLAYLTQPLFKFPVSVLDFALIVGGALLGSWFYLGRTWPAKATGSLGAPSGVEPP